MSGRQEIVQAASAPAAPVDSDLRLPRARRLSPAGYRATFDEGRAFTGRLQVLWVRKGAACRGQVGAVASKRALHLAVARNRARRLLREAYRLNRPRLQGGVDVVLVARTRIAKAKYSEVAEEFQRLCRQAGIWRDAI
ncbi:MAG: ribonuclease P protein component [Kiritimatiellae bacterium]|nr:ribonuclease P protein component [Kiritimatiellia bacterium]